MRLTSKNGWHSPIDSDTINALYKKLAAYEDAEEQGLQTDDWYEIQQAVEDAPTIIEAEGEDGEDEL